MLVDVNEGLPILPGKVTVSADLAPGEMWFVPTPRQEETFEEWASRCVRVVNTGCDQPVK